MKDSMRSRFGQSRWVGVLSLALMPLNAVASDAVRVLVIGDSHLVGSFGEGVLSVLDPKPSDVPGSLRIETSVYASCGSAPQQWMQGMWVSGDCSLQREFGAKAVRAGKKDRKMPTETIAKLAAKTKPSAVVIALGTNQLRTPPDRAKPSVRALMEEAKKTGASCIWVGPPYVRFLSESPKENDRIVGTYYGMLKELSRQLACYAIDSRGLANPKDSVDKIHYAGKAGFDWGVAIGNRIREAVIETSAAQKAAR